MKCEEMTEKEKMEWLRSEIERLSQSAKEISEKAAYLKGLLDGRASIPAKTKVVYDYGEPSFCGGG